MAMSLPQIKQDIKRAILQYWLQARTIRFALVDYRNHPSSVVISDYAAKVQSDFSYDVDEFRAAVDQLETSDNGTPESASFYSGAMAAMSLEWRSGVRKLMVVIGGSSVQNPEPLTGYTWQAVQQKTYALDPVEVYAIDSQGSSLSGSIGGLVDQTGGQTFSDTGDIFGAASSIISHATNKPFGWIQGPYAVKVGESLALDARASYAVVGDITSVDWDLDGDGVFETHSSGLLYTHTFSDEFSGTIGVKVTDANGQAGLGSTWLDVTDDGDSIPRAIDNCPDIANQNQADFDQDGIGDDCDDYVDYSSLIDEDHEEDDTNNSNDSDNTAHGNSSPIDQTTQVLPVKTTATFAKVMSSDPGQFVAIGENSEDDPIVESKPIADNFKASDGSADSVESSSQTGSTSWLVITGIIGSAVVLFAVGVAAWKSKKA